MYTFINSVSLSRSTGSQWEQIDLSNIPVVTIFNTYIKVYLTLTDQTTQQDVFVDLDSLSEHSGYPNTLNDLLVELGNVVLTTVDSIPDTDVKHVRYSDAFRSGYKAKLVEAGVIHPDNYPVEELNDIALTRPKHDTNMSLLHTHCLVSINGFYHRTDTDIDTAIVYNAAKSLRTSNSNHIGITSFLDVGELTKVPLQETNIYGDNHTEPLKDKVYFSVDEELDGKSYILIVGGYAIYASAGVFWRNGDHSFALDLNKVPYIERLYEASLYLDMEELELPTYALNPDALSLATINSDDFIRKYLTMSQSYLVIVDTPNLVTNKVHLRNSNMPGMFTAYQDPTMPLYASYGKAVEYWKTYEDGQWSVTVEDSFLRNYILSMQPNVNTELLNNNLTPMRPYKHSRGYLLDIIGFQ